LRPSAARTLRVTCKLHRELFALRAGASQLLLNLCKSTSVLCPLQHQQALQVFRTTSCRTRRTSPPEMSVPVERCLPASPFRLLDLPPELVDTICDFLPNTDLENVRLVCRTLKAMAMNAFGNRFFRRPIVICWACSLSHLHEISRHADLSKFVRGLRFPEEEGTNREHLPGDFGTFISMLRDRPLLDDLLLSEAVENFANLSRISIDKFSLEMEKSVEDQSIRCDWATISFFRGLLAHMYDR
jgi:hypothetical protein